MSFDIGKGIISLLTFILECIIFIGKILIIVGSVALIIFVSVVIVVGFIQLISKLFNFIQDKIVRYNESRHHELVDQPSVNVSTKREEAHQMV